MHVHISGKSGQSICVRHVESTSYISCRQAGIPECVDDQDRRQFGIALVPLNETEFICDNVPAGRIRALPSALMNDEDELQTILHYRVVDCALGDAFGVHSIRTDRTEVRYYLFLDRKIAPSVFDVLVDFLKVAIFKVQKLYDIIHFSKTSFDHRIRADFMIEERNKEDNLRRLLQVVLCLIARVGVGPLYKGRA